MDASERLVRVMLWSGEHSKRRPEMNSSVRALQLNINYRNVCSQFATIVDLGPTFHFIFGSFEHWADSFVHANLKGITGRLTNREGGSFEKSLMLAFISIH